MKRIFFLLCLTTAVVSLTCAHYPEGLGCPNGRCVDAGQPDTTPDASTPDGAMTPDSGITPDGAMTPDGGNTPDGAMTPDGGSTPDGGMTPDSGITTDGGMPDASHPDGGLTPDASQPDASVTPDAGVTPPDASRPDASVTPDAGPSDAGTCGTCPVSTTCLDGVCVCDGESDDDGGKDVVNGPCKSGKTLLCHYPPGRWPNMHDICVGDPAVAAHMAHGDMLGACH